MLPHGLNDDHARSVSRGVCWHRKKEGPSCGCRFTCNPAGHGRLISAAVCMRLHRPGMLPTARARRLCAVNSCLRARWYFREHFRYAGWFHGAPYSADSRFYACGGVVYLREGRCRHSVTRSYCGDMAAPNGTTTILLHYRQSNPAGAALS